MKAAELKTLFEKEGGEEGFQGLGRVDYRAKGGSKVCPLGLGMDEPRLGQH